MLLHRWREVIDKHKDKLTDEDLDTVERLGSPEAILADLQERQADLNNKWPASLFGQLYSFLKCLQSFSFMFTISMFPHSIETSIAWGFLAILLQLGLQNDERSRNTMETLSSIRQVLTKVNRYVGSDVIKYQDDDVKEAVVEIHVKLLEFWAKAVRELRKRPVGIVAFGTHKKAPPEVEWKEMLASTLTNINDLYSHIQDISDITASTNRLAVAYAPLTFPVLVISMPENPNFFGRKDTLKRMHEHLHSSEQQGLRCYTLYGMGGVGKTQVATSYAYKHSRTSNGQERAYDAVLWVASETRTARQQSFSTIALNLRLPGFTPRSDPSSAIRAVQAWLKQSGTRWLIVFDNAESWSDIMPNFWPEAGATGSVIVTSRNFGLATAPASAGEELRTFNSAESLSFAKNILWDWESESTVERESLSQLLHRLDGLPLAINQITTQINNEGSSIEDFLALYDHIRKILKDLRSSGLISISKSKINIHRLVQSAFLKRASPQLQDQVFQTTASLLNEAFPKQHMGDPMYEHWVDCATYILHTQSLARACIMRRYLREMLDFEGSLELVEIGKQAGSTEHEVLVAHLLNTEGVVKQNTYEYVAAQDALKRSQVIRQRLLGSDHPESTGILQNLASIVAAQCQYQKALQLYQEAEEVSTWPSEQDRRLAACRFAANYARLNTQLGNFSVARSNIERSLEILETGADNPIYRRAIEYCFGNLELQEGNWGEAKNRYRQCLDSYADDIRSKNPFLTCGCYYKLAIAESKEGDHQVALGHLKSGMDLADTLDPQGWVGRMLLLKAHLAQAANLSQEELGDTPATIALKIKGVRKNLESLVPNTTVQELEDPDDIFMLFIPWQTR
ncbi:hypothetical protein QIS74_10819 [Colletotrichum tabaci]|uniref:NB-ARC domain-containing protein n=1 Tax=Colletotrichum tabaci TaxID=1209068 RepID=A0AAV9T1S2_9PEZI